MACLGTVKKIIVGCLSGIINVASLFILCIQTQFWVCPHHVWMEVFKPKLQIYFFKIMQIVDTFILNETSENAVSVKIIACPPKIITWCGDSAVVS